MSRQSNYLSLFNGISAGRLALDRIGKTFDTYFISEIDSNANKVTSNHYPDSVQLGDILNWRSWDIDWSTIDLITSGFPCQSWSIAGHQLGDKDERGMLFWVMLDVMKHAKENNPEVKFMIENVKMKMEFEQYITHHTEEALGEVHKILINSSLVSAQNRNRYYWTNFTVTQPNDLHIHLNDIIEHGFSSDRFKSYCIDANYFKGGNPDQYFRKCRRQLVFNVSASYIRSLTRDDFMKKVFSGEIINRKLKVGECALAQNFPEDWCSEISDTQAYKCFGNAWTVNVISHIMRCCYE